MESITIIFSDGEIVFTPEESDFILHCFELINTVNVDTAAQRIPLNCEGFPIHTATFFALLDMCAALYIDTSMQTVCDYLGCVIPVGVYCNRMCGLAIETGNLKLLQLAHHSYCELTYILCEYAIECKQKDCLKYLLDNVKHVYKNRSLCDRAAMYGSLECLQLAHQSGCQLTDDTRANALRSDSLECLMYACEKGHSFSTRAGPVFQNCRDYYFKYMC